MSHDSVAEKDMLEKAGFLLNEMPKIDTAVKNLLATKIGQHRTKEPSVKEMFGDKAKVLGENGNWVSATDKQDEQVPLDPMEIQKIGGALLRTINQHELEDPISWATSNPQGNEQGGMERIEEISRYKVVYIVWNKTRQQRSNNDKSKGKITLTLGRSVLELVFPQIEARVVSESVRITKRTTEEVKSFLSELLSKDHQDVDLIWATNYQEALLKRSQERTLKASAANEPRVVQVSKD